jgi:hypothetical protein
MPTMRKTYRYKNLSYPVADETKVEFTVRFVSDGNQSETVINVPGPNDPQIHNSGSAVLGKGKDLRGEITVSFSDIANLAPQVNEIKVQYLINGSLIKEHVNPKSEEKAPIVILNIQFPQA